MRKAIRTQSKDPVIQDAAREGVKVYYWSGGYWTGTAKQCARQAHVSEARIRRIARHYVAPNGGPGKPRQSTSNQ